MPTTSRHRQRQQNRALAEVVASKTELVTALLHEVRTPLAAAIAVAGLLPEETGDAMLDETLPVLVRNLHRIEAVLNEIAAISGLENGTVEMAAEQFDLPALLTEVAADAGIALTAPPSGPITGDRDRLGQVFARLLTAVRALGGEPALSATAEDGLWCVALRLPFHRPTDRLFTGTGGHSNATTLMLARAVVARHGGSIAVETSEGTPYLRLRLPR